MSDLAETTDDRVSMLRVLRGEVANDDDAPFFRDDIFFFLVRRVEHQDLDWLVAQLQDEQFALSWRGLVLLTLTPEHQAPLGPLVRRLLASSAES